MAVLKPTSTGLSLVLSLGQEGGKERTKSVSISGIDINASADTLFVTGNALGALVEHPLVNLGHYAKSLVTE